MINENEKTESNPMFHEGFIYTDYIAEFSQKIKKLNKKAIKLGTTPIMVEITTETKIEERKRFEMIMNPSTGFKERVEVKYHLHFTKIIVRGETPKLNGWSLLATIVHDEGLGNMIMVVPGKKLDEKYRESNGHCDHCKTSRYRKETFVVEHEDGTTKVVGRSCIADFLGTDKINRFMWALAWPKAVADLMDSYFDNDRLPRVEPSYDILHVLALAKHSIDEHGYVTVTYAQEHYSEFASNNPVATRDRMWLLLHGNNWATPAIPPYHATTEENEYAEKVLTWAKETILTKTNKTDFDWNISQMIQAEIVKNRYMGFAVAIVSMYRRATEEAILKAAKKPSEYVGNIKDRIDFNLTFVNSYGFDTSFGWMTINRFEDANGNTIVWKTGNNEKFEQGNVYTCKATVKKHEDYKGWKQTEISRPTWK